VGGHIKCIKVLVSNKAKLHRKNKLGEIPSDGLPFHRKSAEWADAMRALGHREGNSRGSNGAYGSSSGNRGGKDRSSAARK
jgi:hypothetical protein